MPSVEFDLNIDPQEMQRLYQGVTQAVAETDSGRRIQFPAMNLRPFITVNGVNGRFKLTYDDQGKLLSLSKLY